MRMQPLWCFLVKPRSHEVPTRQHLNFLYTTRNGLRIQRCSTRVQDLDSSPVFWDSDLYLRPMDLDLDLAHSDLRLGLDTSGLELGYFYLNENTLISKVFFYFRQISQS